MLNIKSRGRTIICMVMITSLYGCSPKQYTQLPEPCPETLILRDLSRQSFEDPATGSVQARVEIDAVHPICRREGNKLSITPQPQFMAVRKDIDKTPDLKSSYFIALADPSGKIIEKRIFSLQFTFEKGKRYCYERTKETLSFELKTQNVKNYRVFLGLEIDESEILNNRNRYRQNP
jgi:hypothetical protein